MDISKFKYDDVKTTYLEDVYNALNKVGEKYYSWPNPHASNDNIVQTIERVFAYEFYHQLRLISEKNTNSNYGNIDINGEMQKTSKLSNLTYPDIIIHGGQSNRSRQKVVIEIKVKNHGTDDIDKLLKYCHELKYEFGVFICLHISMCQMIAKIKTSKNSFNLSGDEGKKIIIITCSVGNLEIKSLAEIVKKCS